LFHITHKFDFADRVTEARQMDCMLQNVINPSSNAFGETIIGFSSSSLISSDGDHTLPYYFDELRELQDMSNVFSTDPMLNAVGAESRNDPFHVENDSLSEQLNFYEDFISNQTSAVENSESLWPESHLSRGSFEDPGSQSIPDPNSLGCSTSNLELFNTVPSVDSAVKDISTSGLESPKLSLVHLNNSMSVANFSTSDTATPYFTSTSVSMLDQLMDNDFANAGKQCK